MLAANRRSSGIDNLVLRNHIPTVSTNTNTMTLIITISKIADPNILDSISLLLLGMYLQKKRWNDTTRDCNIKAIQATMPPTTLYTP